MNDSVTAPCPLCHSKACQFFDEDKFRKYFRCLTCSLVFVPRESILSITAEAERYEHHRNDENDINYRAYLSEIFHAIQPFIKKEQIGLDFGCGKTMLLAKIAAESGVIMDSYDLYFRPEEKIWEKKYDFVVMSEVIEHLSGPRDIMLRLKDLLLPKGQIFIKTKFYMPDQSAFKNWFYKRDLTHVQFFDLASMSRLSQLMDMEGPYELASDLYQLKITK